MLDRISTFGNRLLARLLPNTAASAAQCYYTSCHPVDPCYRRQCCISAGNVTCGGCKRNNC